MIDHLQSKCNALRYKKIITREFLMAERKLLTMQVLEILRKDKKSMFIWDYLLTEFPFIAPLKREAVLLRTMEY